MSSDLYSDYIRREPHPRGEVLIRRWHGKLLKLATREMNERPLRVLEIGPGHGYFAEHCRARGMEYEFCDNSPAVVSKMCEQGFKGYLGLIGEVDSQLGQYDLIWLSHVLEHSPTWVDAREMIYTATSHLTQTGSIVVVSPDVLNWRREFWNVDWSHGYPTSIRNVSQLFSDVGLQNIVAKHHRDGSFSLLHRALIAIVCLIPHRIVDRIVTPARYRSGDGFAYSWKCVFGWRQIFVLAQAQH